MSHSRSSTRGGGDGDGGSSDRGGHDRSDILSFPPLPQAQPAAAPPGLQRGLSGSGGSTSNLAAAGAAFDFELRSHTHTTAAAAGEGVIQGGKGAGKGMAASTSLARLSTRPLGLQSSQSTHALLQPSSTSKAAYSASSSSLLRSSPLRPTLSHSSSTVVLPSHCTSPSAQLEYYLHLARGGHDDDSSSTPSSAAAAAAADAHEVMTPRTRYERLAMSVEEIPFRMEKKASAGEGLEESKEQRAGRTMHMSASSPALLHHSSSPHHARHVSTSSTFSMFPPPSPTAFDRSTTSHKRLSISSSHSSLFSSQLEANYAYSQRYTPTPYGHAPPHSTPLRSADLLRTYILPENGVAIPVLEENARAQIRMDKFTKLLGQRKQRKKKKKALLSGFPGQEGGEEGSDSDGSDLDDLEDDPLASLPPRRPGLQAGQTLMNQIQHIIRSVAEEKAEALQQAQQKQGGGGGGGRRGAHSRAGGGGGGVHDDASDEDDPSGKVSPSDASKPVDPSAKLLQSVVQGYLETSGLSGGSGSGPSSSGGGHSGVIKDREGGTTFTQARLTRDVKVVLDYLKGNTVAKQELMERVRRRQEEKREREKGMGTNKLDKVKNNAKTAWHLTDEVRAAERQEHLSREKARIRAAQARKSEIDGYYLQRMVERDMALLHLHGPEVEARLKREAAEAERIGRVQWGWLTFCALVPITLRFKLHLKEIIRARLTRQVQDFLVPMVRRSYVLNVTSKLHEQRSNAIAKIKRVLIRYIRRWKWRKRRAALQTVWKFLTLLKNAHAIRSGLKDSSLRSQIVKIQIWFRTVQMVIEAQVNLVEIKWNRREKELMQQWARKQKKIERAREASKAINGGRDRPVKKPLPPHLLGPGRAATMATSPPRRGNSRSGLSSDLSPAFTSLTLHKRRGSTEPESDKDTTGMMAPKRVPCPLKREFIKRYVLRKRAAFRQQVRQHEVLEARWHDLHKHELELLKARSEMGFQESNTLQPPPKPVFRLLPPMHELDAMITQASKQYVLSKLRGATMSGMGVGVDSYDHSAHGHAPRRASFAFPPASFASPLSSGGSYSSSSGGSYLDSTPSSKVPSAASSPAHAHLHHSLKSMGGSESSKSWHSQPHMLEPTFERTVEEEQEDEQE